MARFIMAGPVQAIGFILLFAILSVFLPLLSLFSNAAVGLVTLRLGWRRGLVVSLASSIVLGLLGLLLQGDGWFGVMAGLMVWLPVIGFATLLSQTVSWTRTLNVLLLVAVVGVVLFHLRVPDPVQFWQAQPAWAEFAGFVERLQVMPEGMTPADQQLLLDTVAQLLAGSVAASVVVMLVLSLLLARHWQAMLYNPGGFREEFQQLRLGRAAALFMIAMILLALLGKHPASVDVVFAGLAVFVFQGIALVHGTVALTQQHQAWLIGMYVALFVLTVHMGLLLAAFGIIDSLADFRSQLRGRKP